VTDASPSAESQNFGPQAIVDPPVGSGVHPQVPFDWQQGFGV
jgi:hypothetical protein